ncbi:hypothetical protein MRB53_037833 [Persea americana]|nr:hypothetical protein MRB53_037833 [Persea americana]
MNGYLQAKIFNMKALMVKSLLQERRCNLKIWQWNESAGHWMLNTRFDAPHARSTLAIVNEPMLAGFVTIGEDAIVRVWRPKKKTRYGVPLVDAQGQVEIECLITASISNDESQSPAIFFINNNSKMTWSCRYNIATTAPISFSFIGSSLVVASSTMLRVWNVIDERMQSSIQIAYSVDGQRATSDHFILATSSADKSVLVVTPVPGDVQCLRIINSLNGDV